ncbi:GPI inositol-deacylase [Trichinella spiralis]|uniref:GPI inositol-deacylase n=1 Tax=Trichinella spiralis TaxID=6334 RepID=A0ABR3KMP5_TRISP
MYKFVTSNRLASNASDKAHQGQDATDSVAPSPILRMAVAHTPTLDPQEPLPSVAMTNTSIAYVHSLNLGDNDQSQATSEPRTLPAGNGSQSEQTKSRHPCNVCLTRSTEFILIRRAFLTVFALFLLWSVTFFPALFLI